MKMKKFLAALALVSAPAYAQLVVPDTQDLEYVPNGVVTYAVATPANGGINPAFSGVKIEGTIQVGGNSCEGQRYEVGLDQSEVNGKLVLTPFWKLKPETNNIMCIALYDSEWKGLSFSQTIVAPTELLDTAIVKNVLAEGNDVELSFLYEKKDAAVEECLNNIRRFCTKELNPQICTLSAGGLSLEGKGNNKCEAKIDLQEQACQARVSFKQDDISCVFDSDSFRF